MRSRRAGCSPNRGVRDRESELTAAPGLLAQLDLREQVVTGDALFCQRGLCAQIVRQGGAYLFPVKENQPEVLADIQLLFDEPPEPCPQVVSRRHHGDRQEVRVLEVSTALNGYLDWPHVGQVGRITREVTRKGRTARTQVHVITSLSPERASPRRLLEVNRGHWGIENRVFWVRDVTFDEDRCQVRSGAAPQVMAAVRNLVISVMRGAGSANIAARLRRHAAHPDEALALLGLTVREKS